MGGHKEESFREDRWMGEGREETGGGGDTVVGGPGCNEIGDGLWAEER
jgi:hypothetical protein